MSPTPLDNFLAMLDMALAAADKRPPPAAIDLPSGARRTKAEGHTIYAFETSRPLEQLDQTAVELTWNDTRVPGSLTAQVNNTLFLALEHDAGPEVEAACMMIRPSALDTALRDRLAAIADGKVPFCRMSADRLLGVAEAQQGEYVLAPEILAGDPPLDEPARHLLRTALGSDLAWLPSNDQTPALVARLAEAHYRYGRSVLVASPFNLTVDQWAFALAQRLHAEKGFQNHEVLRLGPVVLAELYEHAELRDPLVIDRVAEKVGRRIVNRREVVVHHRDQMQQKAEPLRRAMKALEELEELRATFTAQEANLATLQRHREPAQREYEEQVQVLKKLQTDLNAAHTMNPMKRVMAKVDTEYLERRVCRADADVQEKHFALETITHDTHNTSRQLERLRREMDEQARLIPGEMNQMACRTQLNALEKQLRGVDARLKELDNDIVQLSHQVVHRCKVLCTTIQRTLQPGWIPRTFDVVIIDKRLELSRAMLYYAAGLATQSVVVVGDQDEVREDRKMKNEN